MDANSHVFVDSNVICKFALLSVSVSLPLIRMGCGYLLRINFGGIKPRQSEATAGSLPSFSPDQEPRTRLPFLTPL